MWALILLSSIVLSFLIVIGLFMYKSFKQRQYHSIKEYDQRFTVTPCNNSINYYKFKRNL